MLRRLAPACLLSAWLCASGAMLDLAQVAAWARMFAAYARTESLAAAARETFDPGKPCEICKAVSVARAAAGRHGPALPSAGAEKMLLIFERGAAFFGPCAKRAWPVVPAGYALACPEDVPVPPPKSALA
jgi:hypothetical protein